MEFLLTNFGTIGNALGWALIHFIWQGTLLFFSYWLITRLLLKNKVKTQYWIGMLFVIMCLIVPISEFYNQLNTTANVSNVIFHQMSSNINAFKSTGILSPLDMTLSLIQKIIPYLVLLWMFSVFLISTHLFKSWLFLIKLGKDKSLKLPEYLSTKLEKASKKLKLKFKPQISISKMIDVPATFGFFKPVILLPTSIIAKLPQDQMEVILLHELCHIKRADFLHNILQLLIETLFFYHPLVKWISKDIRKVREQCCDELVLKLNDKPLVYAKALTNIASIYNNQLNKRNATSHIQIAASDGELYERIKFLMLEKRSKSQFSNIFLGLFIIVISMIFLNNLFSKSSNSQVINTTQLSIFDSPLDRNTINRPNYLIPSYSQLTKEAVILKTPKFISTEVTPLVKPLPKNILVSNVDKGTNSSQLDHINSSIIPREVTREINTNNVILEKNTIDSAELNSTLVKPKLIYKVRPIYSLKARANDIQGTEILSFNIDKKGRVKKIVVDKNSPLKLLDGNARSALHKWRFDPKSINKQNINSRYQQIFNFTLGETDQCTNADIGTRLTSQPICQNLL